jgi:threonine aldolase
MVHSRSLKVCPVKLIDLRSDTVTRPTLAMRQAMVSAEVGDDMLGEDPTVNHLEEMVADLFGREAAVFACSGTQSNQMVVRVLCVPGDELLINETGHISLFEGGAPAALSGVTVRTIPADGGFLDVDLLDGKIRANDQHFPRTRLVCLENTTNIGGGRVYPLEQIQRVSEWAVSHGLKRHLDGARVFNAMTVGECFDTISVCFSKGLGCPMGSMLIGDAADILRARRVRKLFGGSLRQVGIVAAAAIYALENHVDRLQEDHDNAQLLAKGLQSIDGIRCNASQVESNLVFFEIDANLGTAVQFCSAMKEQGVLIGPMGGQRMRAVTHMDVNAVDIQDALKIAAECIQSGFAGAAASAAGPYGR